jgi:hypothetical protein
MYTGNAVSEKNSSRKLADQARLPTPRYLIGMRVYECRFPRMSPLGSPVNGGSSPLNSSHKRYRYIDNFLSNQAKSAMEHIHDLRLPLCF